MSKKKKKPRKSLFPWEVDDKYLIIANKGNEILTDAGWEKMTFEEACQFFPPEEIRDWYVSCCSHTDISHLIVDMDLDIDLEDDEAVSSNCLRLRICCVCMVSVFKKRKNAFGSFFIKGKITPSHFTLICSMKCPRYD